MSSVPTTAALQVWSQVFCRHFDVLPPGVQEAVKEKIDEMGRDLRAGAHQRLQGRVEFKLRVGDYRVLYDFDGAAGRIFSLYIGHRREIYRRM